MAGTLNEVTDTNFQAEVIESEGPVLVKTARNAMIGFVVLATTFSLSTQAYVLGHTLAGVSGFLHVSPGLLLLGLLPHAILELTALFLPLAAWIIASRRGEWDQLLAATFVTVAIAVPMLVVAALIEVYVSPHLFTTLTGIHTPIVRYSEGWLVTIN